MSRESTKWAKIQYAHIWGKARYRGPRIGVQEPKECEERGRERRELIVIAVALGDCKHHHHHHRSVYKKNFFPTTFAVGNANLSLRIFSVKNMELPKGAVTI